jgi:hypothetical protein
MEAGKVKRVRRAAIGVRRTLARRPGQFAAAKEVQMDVEDGLAGVSVRVHHRPIAGLGDSL